MSKSSRIYVVDKDEALAFLSIALLVLFCRTRYILANTRSLPCSSPLEKTNIKYSCSCQEKFPSKCSVASESFSLLFFLRVLLKAQLQLWSLLQDQTCSVRVFAPCKICQTKVWSLPLLLIVIILPSIFFIVQYSFSFCSFFFFFLKTW